MFRNSRLKFLSPIVLGVAILIIACGEAGNQEAEESVAIEEAEVQSVEPERTVIDEGKMTRDEFKASMKKEIERTRERIEDLEKQVSRAKITEADRAEMEKEVEALKQRIPKLQEILARADTLRKEAFETGERRE